MLWNRPSRPFQKTNYERVYGVSKTPMERRACRPLVPGRKCAISCSFDGVAAIPGAQLIPKVLVNALI